MKVFLVYYVDTDGNYHLEKIFEKPSEAAKWVKEQEETTTYGTFETTMYEVL